RESRPKTALGRRWGGGAKRKVPGSIVFFFSLMIPRPPPSTLFPYTTLFRSTRRQWEGGCPRGTRPARRPRESARSRASPPGGSRSEEHTSELQSLRHLVCRLLLEKKNSFNQRHFSVSPPRLPARSRLAISKP